MSPSEELLQKALRAFLLQLLENTFVDDPVEVELDLGRLDRSTDLERHREPAVRTLADRKRVGLRHELFAPRLRERREHVELQRASRTDGPGAVAVQIGRAELEILRRRRPRLEVEVRGESIERGLVLRHTFGPRDLE